MKKGKKYDFFEGNSNIFNVSEYPRGPNTRVVNRAKKRGTGTERHGTGKCTGGHWALFKHGWSMKKLYILSKKWLILGKTLYIYSIHRGGPKTSYQPYSYMKNNS